VIAFRKIKKSYRTFTLIEVLIGTILTAILLSLLIANFRHIALLSLTVEKARKQTHQKNILQLRLTQFFEKITAQEAHFRTQFYPESSCDALYFSINQGFDLLSTYSGAAKVTFYLSKNEEFYCLIEAKEVQHKELLAKSKFLRFEFLDSENKKWLTAWSQEKPPSILKIHLEEATFWFMINS